MKAKYRDATRTGIRSGTNRMRGLTPYELADWYAAIDRARAQIARRDRRILRVIKGSK